MQWQGRRVKATAVLIQILRSTRLEICHVHACRRAAERSLDTLVEGPLMLLHGETVVS